MKLNIKHLGIALITAGIVLFVYFTEKKSKNSIYSKTRSNIGEVIKDSVALKAGINYIIAFSAEKEESGGFSEWPSITANIRIISAEGSELFNETIDFTENRETGGLRRAQDYREFKYVPQNYETISIYTEMKEGDKMELEIYEGLDDLGNILPGLSIILAIIGVVIFLKFRNKE